MQSMSANCSITMMLVDYVYLYVLFYIIVKLKKADVTCLKELLQQYLENLKIPSQDKW
jgi:hypothetical protein